MEGRFTFEKLTKYPHLKPEDVAVWERFIKKNPDFFTRVDYDFPVGEGAKVDPALPENLKKDFKILSQKKVDVIGYSASTVYVVEIKPIANMRALGQILTYLPLYITDHPEHAIVQGMVICGEVERELDKLFAKHEILVETA